MFGYRNLDDYIRDVNRDIILTSDTAMAYNNLVYTGNYFGVATEHILINGSKSGVIFFEYYHLKDFEFTREVQKHVFVPNAEKCIIDTILFLDKNVNEGFLIEALQSYQEYEYPISKLYEMADYYGLDRDKVDYWWKEALEESDMSMG